jgi:hypothetical protein
LILFITNRCIGISANNSNYNVHGTASRAPVLKGRFFHGHQQFLFLLPYILSALMIILNGLQFPQSSQHLRAMAFFNIESDELEEMVEKSEPDVAE